MRLPGQIWFQVLVGTAKGVSLLGLLIYLQDAVSRRRFSPVAGTA